MGLYSSDVRTSVRPMHERPVSPLAEQWDRYAATMGELQVAQLASMATGGRVEATLQMGAFDHMPDCLEEWHVARRHLREAQADEDAAFAALSSAVFDLYDEGVEVEDQRSRDDDDGKPNAMQLFGDGS